MIVKTSEELAAIARARVISVKLTRVSALTQEADSLLREVEEIMSEDYESVAKYDSKEVAELRGALRVWHRAMVPVRTAWDGYLEARRRG